MDAACLADSTSRHLRQAAVALSHPLLGNFCSVRARKASGGCASRVSAQLWRCLPQLATVKGYPERNARFSVAPLWASKPQGTLIKGADSDDSLYLLTAWHCIAAHAPTWSYSLNQYAGACWPGLRRSVLPAVHSFSSLPSRDALFAPV